MAVEARNLTVGVGLRHLYGAYLANGVGLGEAVGPVEVRQAGARPTPTFSVTHTSEGPATTVASSLQFGMDEELFLRTGIVVTRTPVLIRVGMTVSPKLAAGAGVALQMGNWVAELGGVVQDSWVGRQAVVGIYAGVSRWRR
jgi:hypothetical protein